MGNEIFIQNKRVCIKPLRSRLEAIQKLQLPTIVKGYRSFVGIVNFLSMFCPELQKLLKPIYDLTMKGRPFVWGKEQQGSFEESKCRLVQPPILHMPNTTGRFHLYSDTSNFATGSAVYQIQNGKPKLITYASKRLPEALTNYSITELELCGLAIIVASFSHLLKRVDFDAIIDHLSLSHIIKSKAEPATVRIKRLLELISSYSFNLYYIKGKDMVLHDFLSRQNNNDSDPHEIIPISFNMHKVLQENYYKIDSYLVQTRSQAISGGIKLSEVHGMRKNLNTNIKSEKQHANSIKGSVIKPCIGQGRAGLKRKRSDPINQTINPPSELSEKIPGKTEIETGKTNRVHSKDPTHTINNMDTGMTHTRPLIPDVVFPPGLTYRTPPKPIRSNMPRSKESSQSPSSVENIYPDINIDFGEYSPFQEGVISEPFQRLDKSLFQDPK